MNQSYQILDRNGTVYPALPLIPRYSVVLENAASQDQNEHEKQADKNTWPVRPNKFHRLITTPSLPRSFRGKIAFRHTRQMLRIDGNENQTGMTIRSAIAPWRPNVRCHHDRFRLRRFETCC